MSLVPLGDSQDPHKQVFTAEGPILYDESACQVDSKQFSEVSYNFQHYPQDQEMILFYRNAV